MNIESLLSIRPNKLFNLIYAPHPSRWRVEGKDVVIKKRIMDQLN